jgi:(p)ppGpp synthase/HD superfamily hydrolase
MIIAMARIFGFSHQLSDRLHNMRTIQYLPAERRRRSPRDDGYLRPSRQPLGN